MTGPLASRPHMPGYDLAADSDGLLSWDWARERLAKSHNYYVATTRPDGRPHVMPVWGVWIDDRLLFSTAVTSTKARNLAANPACAITTETADEAVIVEGTAAEERDAATLKRFVADYNAKYDWEMDAAGGGIFTLTPSVAFGFIESPDSFQATATRWRFLAA
ncbi:MAG: pyridoxamine 5'-phosphate oxidase family protein [Chloroflexi bacterium]|nr:pyridoxamine 5'-phosphate oxidase family protein [Chloroflexota bacterium]